MKVKFFGAESHCGMCKCLRPRVEAWCKEHDAKFEHCNADDGKFAEELAERGIRSIPAVVITCEGKEWTAHGIDGWNLFVESYERVKDESKD